MVAPLVFISSTFLEFKDERENLQRIITKVLPLACNLAETLTCETPNLEAHLKKNVDKADIVILLLGMRYGSLNGKISWTEEEVRYAHKLGKKILPYIKQQKPPIQTVDSDQKMQNALDSFIKFVEKKISPSIPRFADVYDLIAMVTRDLVYELEKRNREAYQDSFTQ